MTYFEKIVLKSTQMPKQEKYNLVEAAVILGVTTTTTVRRYGKNYKDKTRRARLKIEDDNKILYGSFVTFFEQ